MFTGIVEELGRLRGLKKGSKSALLEIAAREVLQDVKLGDSIAVNGVCLTVTGFTKDWFTADVMAETLGKTNLGSLRPGDRVNLERALRLSGRLGGHLVSGHIDGVGTIIGQQVVDIAVVTEIEAPPQVLKYVVGKGSVAIDGISLTVVEVTSRGFTVSLIPHTAKLTTLGFKKIGDRVNLEGDVIGKYVERLLHFERPGNLNLDFLSKHGFL
ncbi:MAG: riboflavin synthase [Clostridia bacterium]|nr:riboflavin synthase [Clostridia bacterium]